MKPEPTRVSQLEAPPPLERLRERVRGVISRLGEWSRRVFPHDQEAKPARRAPERAPSIDASMLADRLGEAPRQWEREARPTPGITGPVRRVTPALRSQPLSTQRQPLSHTDRSPVERRSLSAASAHSEPRQVSADHGAPVGPGEQATDPPAWPSPQAEPPAEPTPEQLEATRRALPRKLLKGTRNGMLLTLEPGYVWAQVLEALEARLAESPKFFQGAVLSLDTRRRPLQPPEVEDLERLLAAYAMTFKEVGSDELNDPRALPSGATRPPASGETGPTLSIRPGDVTNTLFTRRTIRSGQRLRYESSVVIMGDVNSGAEVIAGGDVVVWGALRGTVHAGYPDNQGAVVCALVLAPVQLRIGALASRPPDDGALPPETPEVASVKNGQIVVESWNAGRASRR